MWVTLTSERWQFYENFKIIVGSYDGDFFGNKDLENRDLCRISILSKATLPSVTAETLPLNCYTEKICITVKEGLFSGLVNSKSDCKQFAGEDNVRDVYVNINGNIGDQQNTKDTIERLYADAMYNCWIMTGQGKLDVFRGTTDNTADKALSTISTLIGSDLNQVFKTIEPQCIVCSRLALSDKLIEADKQYNILSSLDFKNYLATQKVMDGSGLTYLQKFTDESVSSFASSENSNIKDTSNTKNLFSNQIAVVFMQVKTEGTPQEIGLDAALFSGTAIVGSIFSTPLGSVVPGGILGKFIASIAGAGFSYLAAEQVANGNQDVALSSCKQYESDEKRAKIGCSLIKSVKWEASEVNKLCYGGIEGNL
jgi:hypothetical protein